MCQRRVKIESEATLYLASPAKRSATTRGGSSGKVVRSHPESHQHARMASFNDRYRLVVAGPIAQAAADIVDARFGGAAAIHGFGHDTVVDLIADQPSLRALVTLLWDLGHELLAVLKFPDDTQASPTS
jgi:hypothetical protein